MKIKRSDLQEIIKEEAIRMFQIQKLQETQEKIKKELKLISEGKKELSDEELNTIFTDLRTILKTRNK